MVSRFRSREMRKSQCENCAATSHLHVHHRDENPRNNSPENLRTLCAQCHVRAHWLIRRAGKTSPIESYLTKSNSSRRQLAALVGVSEPMVGHWCNGARRIKAVQALKIAKFTLYQVTPHQLRPDIWPNPNDALPQKRAA